MRLGFFVGGRRADVDVPFFAPLASLSRQRSLESSHKSQNRLHGFHEVLVEVAMQEEVLAVGCTLFVRLFAAIESEEIQNES